MTSYIQKIGQIASSISPNIADLTLPRSKVRTPTQAFSDFAIHREQGDWAERLMLKNFQASLPNYNVVKYGRTDDIMAGEPGFKDFFEAYQEELNTIGKRPDVLIFDKEKYPTNLTDDICMAETDLLKDVVPNAIAGLEIRSSSYLSKKYIASVLGGNSKKKRKYLSYTVKVEDLIGVIKWINQYNVPHFYVQVFFDSAYIIPFHKILEIISDESNKNKIFTMERNEKNQRKNTIHIDLRQGLHLGDLLTPPDHYSSRKELKKGRLLHYVKFKGANFKFNSESLASSMELAEELSNG